MERYGCVAGYANGAFAGGRPISCCKGAALLLDRFHLLGQQGRLPGIGGIRSRGHGKELSGWRGRYHLFAPWQRRHESLALSRCESCASLP